MTGRDSGFWATFKATYAALREDAREGTDRRERELRAQIDAARGELRAEIGQVGAALTGRPFRAPSALTADRLGDLRNDARFAPYLGLRAEPLGGARPVVPLPDGGVGYCMTPGRMDGCFPPAIATCLQVPVEEVPDAHADERRVRGDTPDNVIVEDGWAAWYAWAYEHGWEIAIHDDAFPVDRERWIGVVTMPMSLANDLLGLGLDGSSLPRGRAAVDAMLEVARTCGDEEVAGLIHDAIRFRTHAVVMCRDRVYHDPAIGLVPPPGQRHTPWDLADVVFGVSFNKRKEQ
jgi:hypothetical protein